MMSRRLGFALAAATAAVLGLASVAWACVPGHDHMSPEEEAEHNALGYHPGAAAPAPAPAPAAPAPTAAATQTQAPTAAQTQTQAPAAAPVAAAAPARTPATVAPRPAAAVPAPTPVAPAPAVAAAAAPAAVATPQPAAAAPPSPLVTSAPEVIPSMPDVAPVDAFADTESQPVATDGGSAREVLGYAVLGLGVVLLVGALLSGMGRWRTGAGPRPLAE